MCPHVACSHYCRRDAAEALATAAASPLLHTCPHTTVCTTGETPQKRLLPLPPALPAFRSDAVVLADLRLALDDDDSSEAAGQAGEAGGAQEKDERGAGS